MAGCLVGCGAVIRNVEGLVMAASSPKMVATFPLHIAEATAILYGIQLAINSGLNPVTVESDAAAVVDWINGDIDLLSKVGTIFLDIKNLLHQIQCVVMTFVSRLANKVARCLSKFCLSCDEDRFWLEEDPPCVRLLVLAEASFQIVFVMLCLFGLVILIKK
ncbi:hypothetical protein LWI28_010344 [Acer negundo]|uniref:RNase H type-1 domain-containing protein n=1 Tax=Acer negundo TaxID=4023 RepID=A0AAD5JJU1_ACENE|nr:hypothetical protein LWI28_010344 [Acer negundo]